MTSRPKILEKYKGYDITLFNTGQNTYIGIINGVRSTVACGSIKAARRVIDTYLKSKNR